MYIDHNGRPFDRSRLYTRKKIRGLHKMPPGGSSTRTYTLYETEDGEPTSHWRTQHGIKHNVKGIYYGDIDTYGPPFEFVVRATSAKQAWWFANESITSSDDSPDDDEALGVWWKRSEHTDDIPPLSANTTQYHALVAMCRAPTVSLHHTRESAIQWRDMIDRTGCGGACRGDHYFTTMTQAEADKLNLCWWAFYDEKPPSWSGVTFDSAFHERFGYAK